MCARSKIHAFNFMDPQSGSEHLANLISCFCLFPTLFPFLFLASTSSLDPENNRKYEMGGLWEVMIKQYQYQLE